MKRRHLADSMLLLMVAAQAAAAAARAEDAPVAQDEAGRLRGDYRLVSEPVLERGLPPLQHVRGIRVTPDCSLLVVHEWRRDEKEGDADRVVVVDVATANVVRVLVEEKGVNVDARQMHVTADGKSVLVGEPDGLDTYDLASGRLVKAYPAPPGKPVTSYEFSGDGRRAAGVIDDAAAVVWDLATAKSSSVALDFVPEGGTAVAFPLAGREEILVAAMADAPDEKSRIVLLDPASREKTTLSEFAGNFDVLPTADGNRAFVLRQEDPGRVAWTGIEEWDLATSKMTRKFAMKPPLSSIGGTLSRDGNTLFLHEYLVRPVTVWDLKTGRLSGALAPEGGGCQAFAASPDGKTVVAIVGPWKEGTLRPEKLAVYDTTQLTANEPAR